MKREWSNRTYIFKNLGTIAREIWKASPIYFLTVVFNNIITNILPVVSLIIMQSIINAIQTGEIILKAVLTLVFIYVFIELFQTILLNLISHYQTKFTLKFNLKTKKCILTHAKKLSLKDYENSETYDSIQRAQYMNEGHVLSFFSMFAQLGGTVIKLLSYSALLFELGGWVFCFVLFIPVIQFFAQRALNVEEVKILQERTEDERRSVYYSQLVANGINFKELEIYNLFDHFISLYTNSVERFNKQDINLSKKRHIQSSLFSLVDELLNGVLFAYIIFLGFMKYIMLGNVVVYTRSIIEAKTSIKNIFTVSAQIQRESLLLDQLFAFLALSPSEGTVCNEEYLIQIDKIDSIELINISYKYRNTDQYVLKDINLKVVPDKLFVILGENGSGKTTLVKIIMGFYDDYEGKILVNGVDLKKINKKSYMEKIGAVFQDFSKYEATLRENISFGNLQVMKNNAFLEKTCEQLKMKDILNLDDLRLDMQLGSWFCNGRQLSIGQWQKVAIARAFVKDADMYILDEPNAALDVIAENLLVETYEKFLSGKIGLIIAHRFHHFIQSADCIVVLKNGALVESGTHSDLLANGGVYATMFLLQ